MEQLAVSLNSQRFWALASISIASVWFTQLPASGRPSYRGRHRDKQIAPALVRLYEQMPGKMIAMGACTITGGMFSADSTTAVRGVDKLIPVISLPGCPPRPEAIFDAVIKLRKKVGDESLSERRKHQQTHRYMTVSHQMKPVEPVVTGSYLRAKSQKAALASAPAGQTLATDAAVLIPAAEPLES